MADAYETILYDMVGEHVAKITLNRPEKRNAQSRQLTSELNDAIIRADQDRAVRVVTLFGAGPSFSAGHDMGAQRPDSASGDDPYYVTPSDTRLREAEDVLYGNWMRIHDLRKPTIAGVQGYLATAGVSLAAMCDIIVASEDAKFFDFAVHQFGLPGTELCWYPWELGVRKAKEFLWTREVWDAHTMERAGLVNRVVAREDLEETVLTMAARIAEASPLAVSLSKRILNHTWEVQGKSVAFKHHLMVQHFAHETDETKAISTDRRKQQVPLSEWLKRIRGTTHRLHERPGVK